MRRITEQDASGYHRRYPHGICRIWPDRRQRPHRGRSQSGRTFQLYNQPGQHAYWVIEQDGTRSWAAAVLPCSAARISAELQKMYFLPTIRGQGLAKKLALVALEHARSQGFKRCYLETTAFLKEAIGLYEHLGFEHIDAPLGCTGHVDCEVRMLKSL
ncbi:MAG: GNAT family N-acetyltransferase [Enterobacter hormaechei]